MLEYMIQPWTIAADVRNPQAFAVLAYSLPHSASDIYNEIE